ncbi:unnamed protein product [Nesidiocoris tenuis]|uniref:Uncharacterized protein n=1 Tax=Nesidiocoris tenuis TaxID=355587 RepID=A0A6H5GRA1_9HEMI|nr:unnamed protein product [Nesidiocoris tenuis]
MDDGEDQDSIQHNTIKQRVPNKFQTRKKREKKVRQQRRRLKNPANIDQNQCWIVYNNCTYSISKLRQLDSELNKATQQIDLGKQTLDQNIVMKVQHDSVITKAKVSSQRSNGLTLKSKLTLMSKSTLISKLNEILPQRKRFSIKRRTDDAVEVTSRKRFCHENGRSSHYIRKPEFHVEDVVKEASISVDTLEKQQPRLETLGGSCPPARPVESLPSIGKKPLPVNNVPLPEDGNCLPPPLNCPTDAPCEKSVENCSESDKKLGDATKNEIDGSPDQGVPSTSSVVLENHSLSSNITLRMITPANLASSTILCPTQSRSNASVNRLEPRKTPRIVVRSSNVALKKIETDIPKIALDDEFIAQQEKRWMNSSRSSKKSSGRNSALAGSPSPKKGYKTTISPAVDVVEKPTDSNLEPSEKEGPISVSKIQSVGEEFGSLNVDRTDATSSKVEVPNGESGVENSETPQNNCNKENSVRKSLANLDSTETYVQPHETLEAAAEDHEIPGEQYPDLNSKDIQTSAGICGNSLNIDSSVAKKDTAVSVSPHQLKARGKMDSVELKNTSEYARSSKPQKGHVKVFDKSTTSNAIVRVESPGKVKASRESSILKPIVSSVNVPSKIVIKKAGRRNKDFKKSSALKEVSQRRTTRLAGLFNASKEKEVFTPSSKIRAQTETQITPERLESDSRRKSESDFSSKRENLVSRRAGCSPEILHIYSRDERDDAKNHCHEKPIPSSLSPLLNEETSKRESGSITSVPRRLPPKSILGERSGSNSFPQTGASDVSRIRLVDSVSKRPKRVWGKSETHSNSICVSEETCGMRSDELTPPKPLIIMRKSSDCNFSPRTSASVSVEHEPHCDLRKHELSGPVNTGRPAMWPPRRIDLDTVGNIYNCITSSFSPDDPRACRELSKMQKTIVHVCGIDWNPDAAEKLATSEMAESPKLLKLDVSAISPTGEKRKRAITVITSTPINRTEDPNLQRSPFALRSKSFGHSVELNSEKPPSGMEHRMVTRNRGRRTILLSSPLDRRTGRPPREKRPSPALSGSPKENYSSRLLEVKRRKNPTDRPKSSKHTRETVESSKMLISPRSLRNVDRLRGEEIPAGEPKKLQTSPAENTLKPKLISLKPRNVNFSSFSASSSSSKVIYVGRNEASFRSND